MDTSPRPLDEPFANPQEPPTEQPERQRFWQAGGIALGLFVLVALGTLLGGELGQFVNIGAQYLPFLLLALLGTLGIHYEWARWVSYAFALMLQGMVGFVVVTYAVLGVMEGPPTPGNLNISPEGFIQILLVLALTIVLFGLCTAVLLPAVRRWLARWMPIDPEKHTHTIALWVVLFMTTTAFGQLIVLGGQPPMLTAINTGAISAEALGERSDLGRSLDLIYGLIWMMPLAFVAAGYPLTRSLGASLERLGLVVPSWRQVAFALAAAVGLALLMNGFGWLIEQVWGWFGWSLTDAEAFETLLGGLVSPTGALVIGVTAGLGEELAVRGLLQPRLGLLLSNLAFTSIHGYQYGFDALLVVFLLGLLLGVVRQRTNTTTAAIIHGTYNALIILVGALFG